MDRERFVGVIMSFDMDGSGEQDYVLTSFAGEGNFAIVFGIAPLSRPNEQKWVIKIAKPDVRFEMTVLHHSLRIADRLFPEHPLLMPADERMRRLSDEMLGRIESDGSLSRVAAYRDMLEGTINLLGRTFGDRFRKGVLPEHFLRELRALTPMLDDLLVMEIESLLENEAFVDDFVPFFEHCVEALRDAILTARASGEFHPLSTNRLFRLLGLHSEGFINWTELVKITESDRFRPSLTPDEIERLTDAVTILHFRAASKLKAVRTQKECFEDSEEGDGLKDSRSLREEFGEVVAAASAAARYLGYVAQWHPRPSHWIGIGKFWLGQTMLLEDKRAEAVLLCEEALESLAGPESVRDRHDVLMVLSELLSNRARERAEAYRQEANSIRNSLDTSAPH